MALKQNWTDKDVITATFLNELVTKVNAGGSSTVDGLTDASALGKSLAKAANAAAARTAIGAMAKAEADQNYVRFTDQNGDPLPPGSVVEIRVNTTTGDIDDIIYTAPEA